MWDSVPTLLKKVLSLQNEKISLLRKIGSTKTRLVGRIQIIVSEEEIRLKCKVVKQRINGMIAEIYQEINKLTKIENPFI